MRGFSLFIFFLFFSVTGIAQSDTDSVVPPQRVIRPQPIIVKRDSSLIKDSLRRLIADSIKTANRNIFLRSIDTAIYSANPFFKFTRPVRQISTVRRWEGKEDFFYGLIALLLFFAFIRNAFTRYLNDLFKLFFRTSVKQRQMREHLMQSPLPSLLFNVFYFLSAGFYITLVLHHFNLGKQYNFWLLYLYSIAGLALVYSIKYLSLRIIGWVFGLSEAVDAYIFIVFTTNKIIGVLLLPFILILAFGSGLFFQTALTASIIIVAFLLVYRYYLTYISVQRLIKLHFFHFLVYLAAFEVAPLLLINKLLLQFFKDSY